MAGAWALASALLNRPWIPRGIDLGTAFWTLFRQDLSAALLGLGLAAAGALGAGLVPRRLLAAIEGLGRRPAPLIAGFTVVAAGASLLVYRAYPLSMDEYAPWFQAKAFAAGRLAGQVPAELLPRVIPFFRNYFLEAARDGRIVESYWPGLALLLTPFMWIGAPWLLNPLIGGASLALLWHLSRKLLPEKAWGWVLLFALASPAFLVNAISFYSMSAHLLCSLAFAALLLPREGPAGPEPAPAGRATLAGAVGSLALVLHNPVPHALFAAPWLAWVALRPRRRHLGPLLLGYLPLGLLAGVGWALLRRSIESQSPAGAEKAALGAMAANTFQQAFALPRWPSIWARLAGFTKLVVWASPGLVALACIGAAVVLRDRRPERLPLRLLALSGLLTLAAYVLVPLDQGHGWGYRYFHSAWGVLPLLAAVALLQPRPDGDRLAQAMLAAAVGSLLLATPLRLFQVRTFIDRQLAQVPPPPATGFSVTFVRAWRGFYTIDLVHNDPFLDGDRWMLYSWGDAEDAKLAHRLSAGAHPVARTEAATVWAIPAGK